MEIWKIRHQIPHEIEVRHYQLLGLEAELLILNEIVKFQYIYMHVIGVPTWVFHIYILPIFHPMNKPDIPMCGVPIWYRGG